MIGEQASYEEKRILGAFNYVYSDMFLHRDTKLMPQNQTVWSALKFRSTVDNKVCLTYLLNVIQAGIVATNLMLNKSYEILNNPKQMVPSMMEAGARSFIVKFLQDFIAIGTLILTEEGGTVFTFEEGTVVTKADLGVGDAYINGDFSVIDKTEGLQDMFTLFIINSDIQRSASGIRKRGWWTPIFLTAGISSAKYFYHHSNEHFSLFLDETMTYSCAIFKTRVNKNHEVLDIGCGWGAFAIEIVKQTGCKYTGITLSKEQIKYAESKVKEADLQILCLSSMSSLMQLIVHDRIKFLLCDYRQLPDTVKYNRILSCEAIEHFGPDYYEEFFRCCESALAEDGIFVLQPSKILSNASNCSVDHVEKIGMHYYRTLRCWRANFLKNQNKILALGFNQEFIRTWEYYFDFTAAGFKTETLLDYQVVFSRPGNINSRLGDPNKAVDSTFN
ncbi:hypothetical protein L1987_15499 [Smallanthus sonchifolius]|uniref:Uncharacterized protein n=1 Tax=Smallanthus sonchifolius TaxID=185202 RepID=A0ACB9J973_9ASTR|nr:hypothetical protein L1987_15499 [Smallanthus sonchifolius]